MCEVEEALGVRRQWLQFMGVPEEEIAELCQPGVGPAPKLAEERRHLEAARGLAASRPSYPELLAWSKAAER